MFVVLLVQVATSTRTVIGFLILLFVLIVVGRYDRENFPDQSGEQRQDDELHEQVERVEEERREREAVELFRVVVNDIAPPVFGYDAEHDDESVIIGGEIGYRCDQPSLLVS